MASVGGIGCTFCRTIKRQAPKERLSIWQIPGVDGVGAQAEGDGDSHLAVECIGFGTAAVIEAWFQGIEALQGTVVTVVDDWATTFSSLLVTRVGDGTKRPRSNLDGNGVCRGSIVVEGVFV